MNDRFLAWRITPEFIISLVVGIISLMTAKFFRHDTIALYILIILAGWLLVRIDTLRGRIKNKENSLKSLTSFILMLVANNGLRKDIVNIVEDNDSYTVVITLDERSVVEFAIPRKEVDKG